MRLPNGFGSVYKLSGKRRKPWVARKTVGWKDIPEKKTSYPIYQIIGYYEKREQALTALTDYNKDPYDLHAESITFGEVYDKWSTIHYEKVSISNVRGSKAAWLLCKKFENMKFVEIKLDHLQMIVDESGKNYPTLRKLKVLLGQLFDYAVIHEIISKDRDMVGYVDIKKAGNPNAFNRKPFSRAQVNHVWEVVDSDEYLQFILILVYTGLRIGEFYNLKKEDVHLEERWFYVRESKTESGIREVPIAEKVVPFFEHWMEKDSEYVFCNRQGGKFLDRTFRDSYWNPMMEVLNYEHRPHDTRHSCISFLTEAGVDERIIKKIVGHKGKGITETVYTHLELPIKLEAINKI